MYSFLAGYDHTTTGVQPFFPSLCHRIDHPIDPGLMDDQIRHILVNGKHTDSFYTNPRSLAEIIASCKSYNVVPVINLNAVWWYKDNILGVLTPYDLSRIARILADYLDGQGMRDKAYISIFNEPGKWLNTDNVCQFTNSCVQAVGGRYPIIAGNDEWNMLDWNYLCANTSADIIGVHPLSGLGAPDGSDPRKYWHIIKDWRTITAVHGKKVFATESGSWFRSYIEPEGHQINKDIMTECKNLDYVGCLIVSMDVNQQSYNGRLGYRIWDNGYMTVIKNPLYDTKNMRTYFQDFLGHAILLSEEKVNKLKGVTMYIPTQVKGSEGYLAQLENELLWKNGQLEEEDVGWVITEKSFNALKAFQTSIQGKYPNIMVDGKCGKQTFRYLCNEIQDAVERENYRFALHVYGGISKL